MNASSRPTHIAILALPETSASVVYGMYDLFMGAGRDWGIIINGQPGPSLIRPQVVSSNSAAFHAANDVLITPQATLDQCRSADVICVPELLIPPGESMDGRFDAEIAWLQQGYASGATI